MLAYWWLSLRLGLVLLSLWLSGFGFFLFPCSCFGRRPKERSLSACGRMGTDPSTGFFRYFPFTLYFLTWGSPTDIRRHGCSLQAFLPLSLLLCDGFSQTEHHYRSQQALPLQLLYFTAESSIDAESSDKENTYDFPRLNFTTARDKLFRCGKVLFQQSVTGQKIMKSNVSTHQAASGSLRLPRCSPRDRLASGLH